jgi:hypothetical protein
MNREESPRMNREKRIIIYLISRVYWFLCRLGDHDKVFRLLIFSLAPALIAFFLAYCEAPSLFVCTP